MSGDANTSPLLTCLLPVRNEERDLPAFLDSVRGYCDAVVALDDGSTDRTPNILAADPVVRLVIRNPDRGDFTAWNDSRNRNLLLRAVHQINPRWIISVDADERIDESDAAALRSFLETDAVPGLAYGFRNAPMYNDAHSFLPHYIWVYRLFHYSPGQRFPHKKLHLVPIPASIQRDRWVKTTLRIQHLGERTPVRRIARFAKYLEADPRRRFQSAYDDSLRIIDERNLSVWLPRPPRLPVLLAEAEAALTQPDYAATSHPAMSVVVLDTGSFSDLKATIASVTAQKMSEPFETLVVHRGEKRIDTVGVDVHIHAETPTTPGRMRNQALAKAQGTFIHFVEAGTHLANDSLSRRLEAHRKGFVMVERRTEAGSASAISQAALVVQDRSGPPGATAKVSDGPPRSCSYASVLLHETGGFPENSVEPPERVINREAFRRGYLAYTDPTIVEYLHSLPSTGASLIRAQFQEGRFTMRQTLRSHQQAGGLSLDAMLGKRLRAQWSPELAAPVSQHLVWRGLSTMAELAGMASVIIGRSKEVRSLRAPRPQLILVISTDRPAWWILQCDYWQRRLTSYPLNLQLKLGKVSASGSQTSLEDLFNDVSELDIAALQQRCAEAFGIPDLNIVVGRFADLGDVFPGLSINGPGSVVCHLSRQAIGHIRSTLSAGDWMNLGLL